MKLKDVTVISLELAPGRKKPEVKAMVSLDFEGVNRSQITHIDLEPSESQAVIDLARQIEERLLAQEMESPEKVEITNIIAVGEMKNSQIQQASPGAIQEQIEQESDLGAVRDFIDILKLRKNQLGLPPSSLEDLESEIATIEAQMEDHEPKKSFIQESLRSIRSILERVAGGLIVAGLLEKMSQLK